MHATADLPFDLNVIASEGASAYEIVMNELDDERIEVSVLAIANSLTESNIALTYPSWLQPVEGRFGDWPEALYPVDQAADLATPGQVTYTAEVPDGAAASGHFQVLSVVFEQTGAGAGFVNPATADASLTIPATAAPKVNLQTAGLNSWPTNNKELTWLEEWFLVLPPIDSPLGVYNTAQEVEYADEIFELTNFQREKKGHTPLRRDPHLDAVAQAHAMHMAEEGFFDHPNTMGMDVFDRLDATDPPDWWTAGENIAAGYPNAQAAVKGWMDSSGHKKNIRNEDYRYVGIGAYHAPGTHMGWYWVQVFATYRSNPSDHDWIEPGEWQ